MDEILTVSKEIHFPESQALLELIYMISAILFIVGLKRLSHPETAGKGNAIAASGMLLALIGTLVLDTSDNGEHITNWIPIFLSIGAASVLGILISKKVKMTAMPQLVSFFNATGGAASAIIAFKEFDLIPSGETFTFLISAAGIFIGSISFTGSLVAYGKLDGKLKDFRASWFKYLNIIVFFAILAIVALLTVEFFEEPYKTDMLYVLAVLSLLYGISFVLPIGGADMPVVISLLNAFTGIAAALAGFLYQNNVMILGGIFVGSAGLILTVLMCKAMNRPLINVIFGSFGEHSGAVSNETGVIKEISLSDASVLLAYSNSVVIVPGYGLAVSQAQHICRELDKLLEERNIQVKYAIHPVAGRMPGHMNVLLAEADVPYNRLVEMDDINPELKNTDVVIVIGANDVVNPSAVNTPGSPIYGMPIIEAYKAKNIIVLKRGMGKGYAGIENPLFFDDKTRMLFGNAKDSLQKLTDEIKSM